MRFGLFYYGPNELQLPFGHGLSVGVAGQLQDHTRDRRHEAIAILDEQGPIALQLGQGVLAEPLERRERFGDEPPDGDGDRR